MRIRRDIRLYYYISSFSCQLCAVAHFCVSPYVYEAAFLDTFRFEMATQSNGAENKIPLDEPNWLTGDLGNYPVGPAVALVAKSGEDLSPFGPVLVARSPVTKIGEDPPPIQQSDYLKPFLMAIAEHGLKYAYDRYHRVPIQDEKRHTQNKRKVIIVGAGMSGLVAAYELLKAGHEVIILEQEHRCGGRVYTFGENQGFAPGLHVDGKYYRHPMGNNNGTSLSEPYTHIII